MKKLICAIALSLLLASLSVAPALADDPPEPDTEIDVEVISPGDVDLDVGISSGGHVDVTVDGYDIDAMAQQAAQSALAINWLYQAGYITKNDLLSYYGQQLEPLFSQLFSHDQADDEQLALVMEALSHLIETDNVTYQHLETFNRELFDLSSKAYANDNESRLRIDALLAYANEINARLGEQEQMANSLQVENGQLRGDLSIASENHDNLEEYAEFVAHRYLYYIWALGGGIAVLLGLLGVLYFKIKKLS